MGFFKRLFHKGSKDNSHSGSSGSSSSSKSPNFMFQIPPSYEPEGPYFFPGVNGMGSPACSVKAAKVLQVLGAETRQQEMEIRQMVEASLQNEPCFSDDSDCEKALDSPSSSRVRESRDFAAMRKSPLPRSPMTPQPHRLPLGAVSTNDERRKSDSYLSSKYAEPSGRTVIDRLLETPIDHSMSPTPSTHSPPAGSGSTPAWSPERSATSTPLLSPKGKNFAASPAASPHRDFGLLVHPLPTPPSMSPKGFENTSRPDTPNLTSKHFTGAMPVAWPLPPLHSDFASASPVRQGRELRSPLPSPSGSPTSLHPSPRLLSPLRSPHRSSCTSPQWSPAHSPTRLPQCPRKWKRGHELGRGSFGTVYEGMNLEDGSFFAVKISNEDNVSPELQQEVNILSQLQHPNIVRYLGTSVEHGFLCIFLELMKCSLQSLLRKYTRFEEDIIRSYARQILLGLEYLHSKRRVHRDIKCGNILVDVNGQVKLADFGVAKEVHSKMASSVKGTPIYMAPEVVNPSPTRSYGLPADIWSLGCTVLEMADGKPPWSNLPPFGFVFKLSRGELPPIPDDLSPDAKDFIKQCLRWKPQDRPTASELLQHRFVANAPVMAAPISPLVSPRQSVSLHSPSAMLEPSPIWNVDGLRRNHDVGNLRKFLEEKLPQQSLSSSPRNANQGGFESQHVLHNLTRSSSEDDLECGKDEDLQLFQL